MNIMMELRQARAAKVDEMKAMTTQAEVENRDFSADEQTKWDGIVTEINGLDKRMARLEALETAEEAAPAATKRSAPNYNKKTRMGDNEVQALAAFFRTGDKGGVSHLIEQDERGVGALTLRLPSLYEQRAVVDSTMNITTAGDGKNIIPTGFVQSVALRKNERQLAIALGVRRVPGKGTTVNYPLDGADPEVFAATNEQADNHSVAYERDAGVLGLKAFTLAKKTRKISLTEELLEDEDVGLMDYIADRIARQMALTHNTMLLTEVASNGTSLKSFASATAIADKEPEALVYHDTLGYYLDDGSNPAWVMRHTTFGQVATITGDARSYAETPAGSRSNKTLLGYPVFHSSAAAAIAASAKSVYFGDWDNVGYREAPELRFIMDPYSVDGLVILKYSFRAVYGVLQAGAIGYGVHPTA